MTSYCYFIVNCYYVRYSICLLFQVENEETADVIMGKKKVTENDDIKKTQAPLTDESREGVAELQNASNGVKIAKKSVTVDCPVCSGMPRIKLIVCWLFLSTFLFLIVFVSFSPRALATVDSTSELVLGPELKSALASIPRLVIQRFYTSAVSTAEKPSSTQSTDSIVPQTHESTDQLKPRITLSVQRTETLAETLTETQSEQKTKTVKPYVNADITNSADNKIHSELDVADIALNTGDVSSALDAFNSLLTRYPHSPRAIYGKIRALNVLADQKRSNTLLEQTIAVCSEFLALTDVPRTLMIRAGRLCADRQSFRGFQGKAIKTMKLLSSLYPDEVDVWNDLGVKCLMAGNKIEEARHAFKQVLSRDPQNGFAMAHFGFIVKTNDRDFIQAIELLRAGIESNVPGVIDGRFFLQLGDALYKTGKTDEAFAVYNDAAAKGLFLSAWQRSLYNVNKLTARPWWTLEETGNAEHLRKLETHWEEIRDEALTIWNTDKGLFEMENEGLTDKGDWRQFTLYMRGSKVNNNCRRTPRTCQLFDSFTAATTCKRGQIKFSVMQPGMHVWPHCGPTNCRIRAHLGLVTPAGPRIRVGNETRTWSEGKVIVLDDSIDHEVWHDGNSFRLILIVDMWHPELTQWERDAMTAI